MLGAVMKQLGVRDKRCSRAIDRDLMIFGSLPRCRDRRSQILRQRSALDEFLPCVPHFPLVHSGSCDVTNTATSPCTGARDQSLRRANCRKRWCRGSKALDSIASSRLNGGPGSVEPFSGALATMTAASSDKNPSGVHLPVHKRFFGAAKRRSLYFLADRAKEKPVRSGRLRRNIRGVARNSAPKSELVEIQRFSFQGWLKGTFRRRNRFLKSGAPRPAESHKLLFKHRWVYFGR